MILRHPIHRLRAAVACLTLPALMYTAAAAQVPDPAGQSAAADGRRWFRLLEYEKAVPPLTEAITAIGDRPVGAARSLLVELYEMRARARFGLGDVPGTTADLRSLLQVDPNHALAPPVSPRIAAVFLEVARSTVARVTVVTTPPDAQLVLDGQTLQGDRAAFNVLVGDHQLEAHREGYRAATQSFTAVEGEPAHVELVLERLSAAIALVVSPPEVTVALDGTEVGRTPQASGGAAEVSDRYVIGDVSSGDHAITLSRPCYVSETRRIRIDKPADYAIDPVRLKPAVATIALQTTEPGAVVIVDGVRRGVAPTTLDDICVGGRTVEVRSPKGRFLRTLDVRAGDRIALDVTLRPAVAVVAAIDVPGGVQGTAALGLVQRVQRKLRDLLVVVPGDAELQPALDKMRTDAQWPGTSARQSREAEPAEIAARHEVTAGLADALGVQGVIALLGAADGGTGARALLFASGAGVPDVIALDDGADIVLFDVVPALVRRTLGIATIDVREDRVVVARVEAGSAAAAVGVKAGDEISAVNGRRLESSAALVAEASAAGPAMGVDLEIVNGKVPRKVSATVALQLRLVSIDDRTLPFNKLLINWRTRMGAPVGAVEEAALCLNVAVALLRVGDLAAARDELARIRLEDGAGIAGGTVRYLQAVVLDSLGDRAEAERLYRGLVNEQTALVSDVGPTVGEAASRRLKIASR